MFDQSPYACRVEWGQRGAREAAERGDITIIVDVLSFSSTVVTALSFGAISYPYPPPINDTARAYALRIGAELALGRAEAAKSGGRSLSPASFTADDSGKSFVLCSLNGAACSCIASKVPSLLVGSLLNATASAHAANRIQDETGANITVVPCGEQWSNALDNENRLRPGIEDYLAAGLILSKLNGAKSPEAKVCIGAYESCKADLHDLVWGCGSGRELRELGYEQDVRHCIQLDALDLVPVLQNNRFVRFT